MICQSAGLMLIPAITGGRSRGRGSASAANGRAEQSDKNKDLFIAVQVYPNSVFDGQDRVDFSRPHDDVQSESSSPMLRFPTHRDDSRNDILRTIRQDVIGSGSTMQTPYGEKLIVYTDWTASGRALGRVEDVIKNEVR